CGADHGTGSSFVYGF
nr:immunoglobulin light chain junction region [Macaca mulatta]